MNGFADDDAELYAATTTGLLMLRQEEAQFAGDELALFKIVDEIAMRNLTGPAVPVHLDLLGYCHGVQSGAAFFPAAKADSEGEVTAIIQYP